MAYPKANRHRWMVGIAAIVCLVVGLVLIHIPKLEIIAGGLFLVALLHIVEIGLVLGAVYLFTRRRWRRATRCAGHRRLRGGLETSIEKSGGKDH